MAGQIKLILLLCLISSVSINTYAQTRVVVIPLFGNDAAKEKVIFITKLAYQGDLVSAANALTGVSGITDGLIAADTLCQADADAPDSKVKGKTFRAWLGPAVDHLVAGARQFNIFDLPYVTPNGDQYASSYTAMLKNPWTF